MRKIILVAALFLISACSSPQKVVVASSDFSKADTLCGPFDHSYEVISITDSMARLWQLRTTIMKENHHFHHTLYARFTYFSDLKYFNTASDDSSQTLQMHSLYRAGGHCGSTNCKRIEEISVDLNDKDLRSHMGSGYRIIITSKSGRDYIFELTPQMIHLQLEALSNYLKSPPVK